MMQLNNVYQRDGFIRFLEEDLLTDFKKDIRPVNTSSLTCIKKAQYLGESKDLDLQVFEFIFEGSANKRVTLTKDAFSVMRSSAIYNALAVFHTEDSKDWRFSLLNHHLLLLYRNSLDEPCPMIVFHLLVVLFQIHP